MLTLLLQIKLVENISCLRMQRMPNTKGESLINALQKKTNNQPKCHTLALAIFIGKIFFQNRSYAHMVDGWHPNILLSAFKLGPLTLFLNWKIKRIFYLNLPPNQRTAPQSLLSLCGLCFNVLVLLLMGRDMASSGRGACIAWVSQQDFIIPSKETKVTEANLNADARSIQINIFEFIIY